MQPTLSIPDLNNNPSSQRIFIVGGGWIVGAVLAFYLSKANTNHQIILLDRSPKKSLGPTGHAPGFVGQLNESPVLARLAQDTVAEYLHPGWIQHRREIGACVHPRRRGGITVSIRESACCGVVCPR